MGWNMSARITAIAVYLVVMITIAGCGGGKSDEPTRYRVSGTARFDGKAIPFGDVLFTPDGSKQNSGAQGIAHIRDGQFDTAGADGQGIAGGPTVVRVTGLSGPGGKLLCEYEYTVDLPRENATHNVEVPAKGAAKQTKPAPEI
jgi:hypothetical protein